MATMTTESTTGPVAAGLPSVGPGARQGMSLAGLCGLVVVVAGFLIGIQPLRDNSFLTHLATGRLILDTGSVPTTDPYSFTALGEPWTVQSWLASVAYAGAEAVGGLAAIRLLVATATALLAWLLWRLTEPAGAVVARVGLVAPVLLIGAESWTERPLLFGLVGLAGVHLLADGRGRAWWALPIFAVWVNVHGSFPLGGVLVVALLAGRWLDREPVTREARVLGWSVLGVLAGALNPVGPRLLVFPLELLSKHESLETIREWRPPVYGEPATQVFVALAVVAALLFVRHRSFRSIVPSVVFAAAAFTGARNIAPAAIVLLAAMAPALAGVGRDHGAVRRPRLGLVAVAVALLAGVAALGSLTGPAVDLRGYPVEALDWMEANGHLGPDSRVVTRDFAGNFLEARKDTDVQVFIDDRYDMYPLALIRDYRSILDADPGWEDRLAGYEPTAVLVDEDSELHEAIQDVAGWEVVHRDELWLVALPV